MTFFQINFIKCYLPPGEAILVAPGAAVFAPGAAVDTLGAFFSSKTSIVRKNPVPAIMLNECWPNAVFLCK